MSSKALLLIALSLSFSGAARASEAWTGLLGQTIAKIVVTGAEPTTASDIARVVAVREGSRFELGAVRRTIATIITRWRFANVEVYARATADGIVLTLDLISLTRLVALRVTGNVKIPTSEISRGVGFSNEMEGDAADLDRFRRAALGLYRRSGFDRAQVAARLEPTSEPRRFELHLKISEGAPTRIRNVVVLYRSPNPVTGALEPSKRQPIPVGRLLGWLRVEPGIILNRARVDESAKTIYEHLTRERYYSAVVLPPREQVVPATPHEVDVVFEARAGPHYDIRFSGNRNYRDAELYEALKFRDEEAAGEGLPAKRRRLERFYREAGFVHVRVALRQRGDLESTVATFDVSEGPLPRLVGVNFLGARAFTEFELRAMLTRAVMRQFPTRREILDWNFEGVDLAELDSAGITSPLDAYSGRAASGVRAPRIRRELYIPAYYRNAVTTLLDHYRANGFRRVEVGFPRLTFLRGGREVVAEIPIVEGVQTKVRSVALERVDGIRRFTRPLVDLKSDLSIDSGDPLDLARVEDSRDRVGERYRREGYMFSKVDVDVVETDDGRLADVKILVREGRRVRFGVAQILSDRRAPLRTRETLIRSHLAFHFGDPLDPELMQKTQRRLMDTGLFSNIIVQLVDPSRDESYKDVRITVYERPPQAIEVGAGFSKDDGPRAFVRYAHINLIGSGLRLTAEAKTNYQLFLFADKNQLKVKLDSELDQLERTITAGLYYPRIPGLPFDGGLRLDIVHERVTQLQFALDRNAVIAGVELKFWKAFGVTFQTEFERSDLQGKDDLTAIDEDPSIDAERKRYLKSLPVGVLNLITFRPILTLDLRDDPFNPTRGAFLHAKADFSKSVQADEQTPINFAKVTVGASGYIPLPRQTVLAFKGEVGRIFQLQSGAVTPAYKQYLLGGQTSLRGFPLDSVVPIGYDLLTSDRAALARGQAITPSGGDAYVLFKGEFRFPVVWIMTAAVFLDAGNLWLTDFTEFDLRVSAGGAIRLTTPVGSISFEMGWNLRRNVALNEPTEQFHFSIGSF